MVKRSALPKKKPRWRSGDRAQVRHHCVRATAREQRFTRTSMQVRELGLEQHKVVR
jgi:hypothetical protein